MKPQRTPKRRKPPRRKKALDAKPVQPTAPKPPAPPPMMTPGAAPATAPAPARRVGPKGPVGPVGPKGPGPSRKHPAARRPRPAAKKGVPAKPVSTGGGISVLTVMLLVLALILAGMMLKVMLPPSLSGTVKGYPKARWTGEKRNLLAESQQALLSHDKPLQLSEQEVNAYLRDRIQGKQGGAFSALVKYQGTYVDFKEGSAEFYVVRTVMGKDFPVSAKFVAIDVGGGRESWMIVDGSVGGLRSGKRQFDPVYKAIRRVQAACEDEMDVLSRMGKITFKDNVVILDPKG